MKAEVQICSCFEKMLWAKREGVVVYIPGNLWAAFRYILPWGFLYRCEMGSAMALRSSCQHAVWKYQWQQKGCGISVHWYKYLLLFCLVLFVVVVVCYFFSLLVKKLKRSKFFLNVISTKIEEGKNALLCRCFILYCHNCRKIKAHANNSRITGRKHIWSEWMSGLSKSWRLLFRGLWPWGAGYNECSVSGCLFTLQLLHAIGIHQHGWGTAVESFPKHHLTSERSW